MRRWFDAGWLRVPGLFWVGSCVVRGWLARGLAHGLLLVLGESRWLHLVHRVRCLAPPLCAVLRTTICYRLELGSTLVRKRFAVGCRW